MTSPPAPPTTEEIALTRDTAFSALQASQAAYDAALAEHEDFRRRAWLPTPRRHRAALAPIKAALADDVTRTRTTRDELLTSPLILVALTARQREQACHLTREGRRRIERARGVPPSHPAWAPPPAPEPAPANAADPV